jgi:thymidylate synthase
MSADIVARDFNHVCLNLAKALNKAHEIEVRSLKCKELQNFSFVLLNSQNCICTIPARKLNEKYMAAELLWYLSGDSTDEIIYLYASLWKKISKPLALSPDVGHVQSNYGATLFKDDSDYGNGMTHMVNMLVEDKFSRKAVCPLNSIFDRDNLNDLPCTMHLQLMIRSGYLNLNVNMRSNDFIYGTCFDVIFFSLVHQIAYLLLKSKYPTLKLGFIHWFASSLHVYEKHYTMTSSMASATLDDCAINLLTIDNQFIKDLKDGTKNSSLMKRLYETSQYPVSLEKMTWIDRFINKNALPILI